MIDLFNKVAIQSKLIIITKQSSLEMYFVKDHDFKN